MVGDVTSEGGTRFRATHNRQVSAMTYYLEHENIEIEFQADPYGISMFHVVEQLLSTSTEKVYDSLRTNARTIFIH
jgi:hypothetical protein